MNPELDRKVDKRISWANRGTYLMLAVIMGCGLIAMPAVLSVSGRLNDERALLREQNELLEEQNRQLARFNRAEQANVASAQERLRAAIAEVDKVLQVQFAQHDENMAWKMNELLARVAALLDRPVPAESSPVPAPASRVEAAAAPAPSPPPPPRTTTTTRPRATSTTTSPDQKRCALQPAHPRC